MHPGGLDSFAWRRSTSAANRIGCGGVSAAARTGPPSPCTFRGDSPEAALKLAELAKGLVESRSHNMTRAECYAAILGVDDLFAPGMPTVRQWVETWLAEQEKRKDIDPETVAKYGRDLRLRAVPYLGHLRLSEVTPEVIRGWVQWLTAQRATKGSKNRVVADRLISAQTVRHVSTPCTPAWARQCHGGYRRTRRRSQQVPANIRPACRRLPGLDVPSRGRP
jgi:hypothetical protein